MAIDDSAFFMLSVPLAYIRICECVLFLFFFSQASLDALDQFICTHFVFFVKSFGVSNI